MYIFWSLNTAFYVSFTAYATVTYVYVHIYTERADFPATCARASQGKGAGGRHVPFLFSSNALRVAEAAKGRVSYQRRHCLRARGRTNWSTIIRLSCRLDLQVSLYTYVHVPARVFERARVPLRTCYIPVTS